MRWFVVDLSFATSMPILNDSWHSSGAVWCQCKVWERDVASDLMGYYPDRTK